MQLRMPKRYVRMSSVRSSSTRRSSGRSPLVLMKSTKELTMTGAMSAWLWMCRMMAMILWLTSRVALRSAIATSTSRRYSDAPPETSSTSLAAPRAKGRFVPFPF